MSEHGEHHEEHHEDCHYGEILGHIKHVEENTRMILREVKKMAVDQATFDAELQGLVQAVQDLDTAVDAFIAAQPAGVDLTAEAQSVSDAQAALVAELAKVTPAPPAPPAPAPAA